ncbi:MAG: porin [Thiomicrorhabdus sp.]|jgi:predicted porin|nr:porin [Thiomicrorhabdus sp.]
MKKNIIALAIASAIAAPVAFADAPTVYGQANVSIDSINVEDATGSTVDAKSGTQVNSRASRIGVKGSEDLGNGLKAIYKMEFGVDVDGPTSGLSNRNQYVGLAGGFGTVLMGRHDTPTKMSQVTDFFNDSAADLKQSSLTSDSSLKGGEIRASNVVAYVSPSFGGVKIAAAAVASEGAKVDDAGNVEKSGLADTYSVAAMYGSTKSGLYLAAAYDSYGQQFYTAHDGESAVNIKDANYTRFSAQYATGGLVVNGMYAMTDLGKTSEASLNDWDSDTMLIGAAYTMGKLTPKVKYSVSSYDANFAGISDKELIAVGLDYALGKKTTGYVEYVDIQNSDMGIDDTLENTMSVGLLHKF